jgi:hypothetical protein
VEKELKKHDNLTNAYRISVQKNKTNFVPYSPQVNYTDHLSLAIEV